MKTPLNVMIDVQALEKLNAMAAERKKTRTAMVTELIMGTSKGPSLLNILVQAWYDGIVGDIGQTEINELKEMLRR